MRFQNRPRGGILLAVTLACAAGTCAAQVTVVEDRFAFSAGIGYQETVESFDQLAVPQAAPLVLGDLGIWPLAGPEAGLSVADEFGGLPSTFWFSFGSAPNFVLAERGMELRFARNVNALGFDTAAVTQWCAPWWNLDDTLSWTILGANFQVLAQGTLNANILCGPYRFIGFSSPQPFRALRLRTINTTWMIDGLRFYSAPNDDLFANGFESVTLP